MNPRAGYGRNAQWAHVHIPAAVQAVDGGFLASKECEVARQHGVGVAGCLLFTPHCISELSSNSEVLLCYGHNLHGVDVVASGWIAVQLWQYRL
jgi:hypothetical protein